MRRFAAMALASASMAVAAWAQPVLDFEDGTAAAGLEVETTTFGVAVADLDGDGDDDLLVSRHGRGPHLLLNENGVFTAQTRRLPRSGADRHGVTVVDLDNDGDRDVLLACGGADGVGKGCTPWVFESRLADGGKFRFRDVTKSSGIGIPSEHRSRVFLPVATPDGRTVDLLMVGKLRDGYTNLYRRNVSSPGSLAFRPAPGLGADLALSGEGDDLVLDLDLDGDQDILLLDQGAPVLLRREADRFTRIDAPFPVEGGLEGMAAGDFDLDGRPDLYLGARSIGPPTDRVAWSENRIHVLVEIQGRDRRDRVRFRAEGPTIEVDHRFKPGIGGKPEPIRVGPDGVPAGKGKATVERSEAAGRPPGADHRDGPGPGIWLWYEPVLETWEMRWERDPESLGGEVADPDAARDRVEISGSGFSRVELREAEQVEPPEVADRILLHGGRLGFVPLPGSERPHRGLVGSLLPLDVDLDGRLDLVLVPRSLPGARAEPPLVLRNLPSEDGWSFSEVRPPGLVRPDDPLFQSDSVVTGLFDGDLRPDLFVTRGWGLRPGNRGPYGLFLSRVEGGGRSLGLDLVGTSSNRDALGARVTVRDAEGELLVAAERAGWNRAQSAGTWVLGVGSEPEVQLEIVWPAGTRSRYRLATDRRYRIVEPAG